MFHVYRDVCQAGRRGQSSAPQPEVALGLERHYKVHGKNTVLRKGGLEKNCTQDRKTARWEEKEKQISQVLNVLSKNLGLLNSL